MLPDCGDPAQLKFRKGVFFGQIPILPVVCVANTENFQFVIGDSVRIKLLKIQGNVVVARFDKILLKSGMGVLIFQVPIIFLTFCALTQIHEFAIASCKSQLCVPNI